ncbi:MAG: helix-turn-helix domain-containing protein [Sphaerochaetaceae bacterium]|nr:helix-turn-helix domain-containing protein [Spirochaetales bacterium]MDY5499291.1 helix-turn-helix domain-containing protein [Sphaerochaetaceae bacterium]
MKRSLHVSRFFIRLLVSFLLLILFFALVLIGFQLKQRGNRRAQIVSRLNETFQSVATTIDTQVTTVQNLGVTFFLEPDAVLYFRPDKEKTLDEKSQQWRLHRLLNQQELIMPSVVKNLFAFIPGDTMVLTSAGHYDTPFFFSKINSYEDYDERFWETRFTRGGEKTVLPATMLVLRGSRLPVLPIVTTARISNHTVVHVSNMNMLALQKLFVDTTLGGSAIFALVRQDGQLLYSSNTSLVNADNVMDLLGHASGTRIGSWYQFSFTGGELEWRYLALVPNGEISRAMDTGVLIWIVILLLALTAVCIALLLAFRLYRPIGQVNRMIPRQAGDSNDELTRIQQGIGRLINDNQSMQESYARHALHLLLLGLKSEDSETLRQVMRERFHFHGERLVCALFFFDFHTSFYQQMDKEQRHLFVSKIPLVLGSYLEQVAPSMVFDLHGGMFACVTGVNPLDHERVVEGISGCKVLFEHDFSQYSLHVGIGSSVDSLEKISLSYNQALLAVRSIGKNVEFGVVAYSQLQKPDKVSFDFYDQKALEQSLLGGTAMTLSSLLDGIFSRNDPSDLSAGSVHDLNEQLYQIASRVLSSQHVEAKMESGPSLSMWLEHPHGDGRDEVRDYFLEVQRHVASLAPSGAEVSLALDADSFIATHYQEPLSLDIIADHLGVTGKYLSRVYKAQRGVNITSAVSRIRMERAKVLLREVNLKIGDVAVAVGMDSRATFLRVFKKTIGISPTEFRALIAQEGMPSGGNNESENRQ